MKEEIKLSLFADGMTVYFEKSERTDKKTGTVIARFQDIRLICKSQLLSYMPAMNKWSLKLEI